MKEQLVKQNIEGYSNVYPLNYIENILMDNTGEKSLKDFLPVYNHISIPYEGTKEATRLRVPKLIRKKGLWISYEFEGEQYTEKFIGDGDVSNDLIWKEESRWEEVLSELNENRPYNEENPNGLGYIVLDENIINGSSVLTQDMINTPNTIYEIRYDYDLQKDTINVPANSVLKFEGGTIKNGKIKNANFQYIKLSWVGGKADYNDKTKTGTDNSDVLKYAIELASDNGNCPVYIDGNYYFSKQIDINVPINLIGSYYPKQGTPNNLYSSRIIVAPNVTLFNIIGFNSIWYALNINNLAFLGINKSSILISSNVSNGPARPLQFNNCEAKGFNRVFNLGLQKEKSTNAYNLSIQSCVLTDNYEVIVADGEGKGVLGGLHLYDSVIEHNGISNTGKHTINGVIYINSAQGYIQIENNLMEGQPRPIHIISKTSSCKICGNYFEANNLNDTEGEKYLIKISKVDNLSQNFELTNNSINASSGGGISLDCGYYCDITLGDAEIFYLMETSTLPEKYISKIPISKLKGKSFNAPAYLVKSEKESTQSYLPLISTVSNLYNFSKKLYDIDILRYGYSSFGNMLSFESLNIQKGSKVLLVYHINKEKNQSQGDIYFYINGDNTTGKLLTENHISKDNIIIHYYLFEASEIIDSLIVRSGRYTNISCIGLYIVDGSKKLTDYGIPSKELFLNMKIQGTTLERPKFNKSYNSNLRFQYYDTTLNKEITWNGTEWVTSENYLADAKTKGHFVTEAPTPSEVGPGFQFYDYDTSRLLMVDEGGSWVDVNSQPKDAITEGDTASRPTNVEDRFQYYDTDLKKFIWKYHAGWIDANGTTV